MLVRETLGYEVNARNRFLLDGPAQPDGREPSHRVNEDATPWLRTVRTNPGRTPLGWSKYIGKPVFWLTD